MQCFERTKNIYLSKSEFGELVAESRELFKEPVIHILAFYPTNTCGHRGPHAPKVTSIYYVSTF